MLIRSRRRPVRSCSAWIRAGSADPIEQRSTRAMPVVVRCSSVFRASASTAVASRPARSRPAPGVCWSLPHTRTRWCRPEADLAPGEYALVEYTEGLESVNTQVWDFKIVPQ